MIKKLFHASMMLLFFVSCSHQSGKNDDTTKSDIVEQDSLVTVDTNQSISNAVVIQKPNGINVFIDSLMNENWVIDTNRLKKVWAWRDAAKCAKVSDDGVIIIKFPFPVKEKRKYFKNPKTYFLVHRTYHDSLEKYIYGEDYILMTWEIDSAGISIEQELYQYLTGYMFNFPCYCFRHQNRIYALGNRMSVNAERTLYVTRRLRDYINSESPIYGGFDAHKIE